MATSTLPKAVRDPVTTSAPSAMQTLREIASADGALVLTRAGIVALEPVNVWERGPVKLRFWFVGTAESATISILTVPKGGGVAEKLWAGTISSGVAQAATTHPVTGETDADSWHEIDTTTTTFSKGEQVVDEYPPASGEVTGYPKSFEIREPSADLLTVHVSVTSAELVVGIECT